MISGWNSRYNEILKEFKYNKQKDTDSAVLLESIIKNPNQIKKINQLIKNQTILVIGSGPSLSYALPKLKKLKKTIKIVADSALKPIVENGEITIGNMMKVTLSCDHRIVDGAKGAAFLQTLKLFLENPVRILL